MFLDRSIDGVLLLRGGDPRGAAESALLGPSRRGERESGGALGLRVSSLGIALLLHAALLGGGFAFGWFGIPKEAQTFPVAQVSILPPEKAQTDPLSANTVTPAPPLHVPEPAFAVEASEPLAISAPPSAASPVVPNYLSKLSAHLARYKRFPLDARSRRLEGEALVRFRVDRRGRVLSFEILRSSGSAALDAEVAALLLRAQPLPPIPNSIAQDTLTVILPIEFSLRS
jgi:TonB family protein